MPKSTPTCNSFMALLYNATPWANVADNASSSPITGIYMGLHILTGPAAGADQTSNEANYTLYARVSTDRSTGGWTAPAAGATSNVAAIDFPQCGVTGATITYASTGKAASGAQPYYHTGALNSPITVSNLIQPRFAAGAVTITES